MLTIGLELDDDFRVAMNQAIKYEGQYYAYDNGQGRLEAWTLNAATSPDLVHWRKYAGNPLLSYRADKTSGLVVHDGQGFRLYTMNLRVDLHM